MINRYMEKQDSPEPRRRLIAILQALLVTFLWSTSWVLIKAGLRSNLPPVTFAGLRYTLAFLVLLPFLFFNANNRQTIRSLTLRDWIQLALLGLLFYSITQGAQFVSLAFLPAATLSLLLNLTPLAVALISGRSNAEPAPPGQWAGIALSTAGTVVYFLPLDIPAGQWLGLAAAMVCLLANAISSVFGRRVNRNSQLSPLVVTSVSMGIGGILMLGAGGALQGFGRLDSTQWLIIIWLAVVNTALAFTLWNESLRTITALESSVLNGTMLPQIAILAWLFLAEPLSARQIAGMVLVVIGTLVVQLWHRRSAQARKKPVNIPGK